MTEAQAQEQLVERVVVGPKCIHYHDPETGARVVGEIGKTIRLPLRSANTFARYLEAPEVAAAKAEVAAAEAAASKGADDTGDGSAVVTDEHLDLAADVTAAAGGDSSES